MSQGRSRALSTTLVLLIGAGSLYLALRGTDLDATWQAIRRADLGSVLAALALLVVSYSMRAYRWHVLLRSQPVAVRYPATWEASSIGYMFNNVLPARAGDVIRSIALKRRAGVSRSFGFATTVAERAGDVIWLAALTLVLGVTNDDVPGWLSNAALILLALSVGAVALLGAGYAARRRVVGRVRRLDLWGHAARVEHIIRNAGNGLAVLGEPRRAGVFAIATIGIWLVDATSLMFVVASVGATISLDEALLMLCALGLASAAPSTPGYVGIFQLVAVSVLPAFGVARADALAAIVVFQAVILVEVLGAGLVASWRVGFGASALRDARSGPLAADRAP